METTTQDPFDSFLALTSEQTRKVDLGDYAAALKGQTLTVRVNVPGVMEASEVGSGRIVKSKFDSKGDVTDSEVVIAPQDAKETYERYRRVVSLLYGLPIEQVRKLEDAQLMFLHNKGMTLYNAYHEDLKKN